LNFTDGPELEEIANIVLKLFAPKLEKDEVDRWGVGRKKQDGCCHLLNENCKIIIPGKLPEIEYEEIIKIPAYPLNR
jgi:hypothetical protein